MVDYRHRITKEVRSFAGNSPEGRDLAKDPEWDKCPPSETEAEVLPIGVQNAPVEAPPVAVIAEDPTTTTPPSAA